VQRFNQHPSSAGYTALLFSIAVSLHAGVTWAAPAGISSIVEDGQFGLYRARDFRLTDGRCTDCTTVPQALWYFQEDVIAVPKASPTSFVRTLTAQEDVRQWAQALLRSGASDPPSPPPLLWVGAPLLAPSSQLSEDGKTLVTADGKRLPFAVTERIPSNLSYYDASSVKHFAQRPLRVRGRMEGNRFVARSLWPEDYALDFARLPYQPLAPGESLQTLVRADAGGARQPLSARILWQRDPKGTRSWAGKPVLAMMLNGAQGDDDEAHGGHFAVATGTFGAHGEWSNWLVNNFYNLDSASEKGIIAATLPMDGYMADLNSGQSWYRPSAMLVAVLKQERAAALYQQGIGRVFNHFYRHDFEYQHAAANCAGINLETLRSLGWNIPAQGPTSRAKAVVALPYMTLKEWSLESGRKAFDYLVAERTNLYPFVAFEAAGQDLLQRIVLGQAQSPYERMLAEDIEAIVLVRIPQFPSSRAFGQAPIASLDEYMERVPENKADWKIVPAGPRPFPAELRDPQAPAQAALPSAYALYGYGGVFGLATLGIWRRRKKR